VPTHHLLLLLLLRGVLQDCPAQNAAAAGDPAV